MSDEDKGPGAQRLFQMNENLEYRVAQLESERLPARVQQVEFIAGQLQGEMTAIKEISRGIGVKLDSGIQELKAENLANRAFIRGALWLAGAIAAFIYIVPTVLDIIAKSTGVK